MNQQNIHIFKQIYGTIPPQSITYETVSLIRVCTKQIKRLEI